MIKVTGNSLEPDYKAGDYLVSTKLPFMMRALKPGDLVIFNHPGYGRMVKRIQWVDHQVGEMFVVGTHPESTDSRHFGPIPRSWLTGKVLWHIPKPG